MNYKDFFLSIFRNVPKFLDLVFFSFFFNREVFRASSKSSVASDINEIKETNNVENKKNDLRSKKKKQVEQEENFPLLSTDKFFFFLKIIV